jgi:hypothetical protein
MIPEPCDRTDVPSAITLNDGDEVQLGRGLGGEAVEPPDSRIRNLRLAVARVFAASGAAEVFDKHLDDDYMDMSEIPVYFGGPFFSDDELIRRLEVLIN